MEMEGGGCPNLSQSVCAQRHKGGTTGGAACCVSGTGRPTGWQADCLGGWWGGLVCHFCYDFHGCQSEQGSS